ncbi:MAG TPA: hypothetical protein VGJ00_06625 [Rhabdochlamydiaceae bacterium]|jgi:hypothetical protein
MSVESSYTITNYTPASYAVRNIIPEKLWKKGMPGAICFLNNEDIRQCEHVSKEFRFTVTLWGLKHNWWKQLIDGVYHDLGPLVFDKGLHGCHVEPGFYRSAREASCLVSERFFEPPLNITTHRAVNKTACKHFAGKKTQTEMSAEEAGVYRHKGSRFGALIWNQLSKEAIDYFQVCKFFDFCGQPGFVEREKQYENEPQKSNTWSKIRAGILTEIFGVKTFREDLYNQKLNEFSPKKETAYAFRETWPKIWCEKVARAQSYIEEVSQSLGLDESLVSLRYIPGNPHNHEIYIVCPPPPYKGLKGPVTIGELADRITKQFNQEIAQADTRDKKIRAIAKLFQLREWLHAFVDGNTRTNMIELGALLTKYGEHPAILEQPFIASALCLDEWVEYLKKGMQKWEIERGKL